METEMQTRLSVKAEGEVPEGYSTVKLMENRDAISEDAHQCHYCTDFAYFSLIHCSRCSTNYCIWHNVMCGCNVPAVQLVYRFSSEEIRSYKAKVAQIVREDNKQKKAALQAEKTKTKVIAAESVSLNSPSSSTSMEKL